MPEAPEDHVVVRYFEDAAYSAAHIDDIALFCPDSQPFSTFVHQCVRSRAVYYFQTCITSAASCHDGRLTLSSQGVEFSKNPGVIKALEFLRTGKLPEVSHSFVCHSFVCCHRESTHSEHLQLWLTHFCILFRSIPRLAGHTVEKIQASDPGRRNSLGSLVEVCSGGRHGEA
jgi:hypothetical protein